MCPFYLEHNPPNGYYQPNYVPIYLLDLNGYTVDEKSGKVIKLEDSHK